MTSPAILAFLAALSLPVSASAQTLTGTILGTVRDDSGLVLADVTVTLSSPALMSAVKTVTDAAGDFLFAALYRAGLANQPESRRADDGLKLIGAYVAAAVRCAPPGNKPLPEERDNCAPYLQRELALLHQVRSIVALGSFAWDAALRAMAANGHRLAVKPRFGHGAAVTVGPYRLFGTYHPSQQNTFTGVLTPAMLDAVLAAAKAEALS